MRRDIKLLNRAYWLVKDLIWGSWCGFPLCCVWDFTIDMWKCPVKNYNRITKNTMLFQMGINPGYSPCEKCWDRMVKEKLLKGGV
jgi:hypothetical protein